MAKRKQKFKQGDIFIVPLDDGTFGVGQVLLSEGIPFGGLLCALFNKRLPTATAELEASSLSAENAIFVEFITPDSIWHYNWTISINLPPLNPYDLIDLGTIFSNRFIGTKIYSSNIVDNFLDAFFELDTWDKDIPDGKLKDLLRE